MGQKAITVALLNDIYAIFSARYAEGMQRGRAAVVPVESSMYKYLLRYTDAVDGIPSTNRIEKHTYISQIPGFIEWAGDRVVAALVANGLEVEARDFALTVKVPRNDILDDNVGGYAKAIGNGGAEASDDAFWLDLAVAILTSAGAGNVKWADDAAFFSATRKFGANTINNVIDGAITQARIKTAISQMINFKGDKDIALNVVPYLLLCGATAFWDAKSLLEDAEIVVDGDSQTNQTRGVLTPRWHPGLNPDAWYVLGIKGGFKPLAVQRRQEAGALNSLVNTNDPNVFWHKEYVYGADLRGEGFLPLPILAIRGSAGTPAGAVPGAKKEKEDGAKK